MSVYRLICFCCCASLSLYAFANELQAEEPVDDSFTPQQLDNFENSVRPILVKRCNECHANGESEGGLSMQSRKAMLKGGDSGAAFVPGDSANSLLVQAIHYDDVYEMPPDSKLPDEEIRILESWINDRAPWPEHSDIAVEIGEGFDINARKQNHWCWQGLDPPRLPHFGSNAEAVDWLIDAKLESAGLAPNPAASRSTLLRRISFDITGLPPSQSLVNEYVLNESITTEEVVDQLLDSPHFGERWARHWMDLFRYAETYGHEFDYPIRDAWRYRDYLIRAFNVDLPYDRFIVEHIAGDLLETPRTHPNREFNESILATGFWFLGEATHGPVDSKADEAGRVDNQIDVMCRSFIGMTVACARCHDHKFDAISTKDYYALSGFLQSSRRHHVVIDEDLKFKTTAEKVSLIKKKLESLSKQFRDQVASVDSNEVASRLVAQINDGDSSSDAVNNLQLFEELPAFRSDSMSANHELLGEFPLDAENWKKDGFAFSNDTGAQFIHGENVEWLPDAVVSSANHGERFAGLAHSATFELKKKFIHVRMKAKKARVELVVDGFKMHEFNPILFKGMIHKDVNHDEFKWLTIGQEVYLHLGSKAWLEFEDRGEGYFVVDRVVFSDDANPPNEPTPSVATRWKKANEVQDIHDRALATVELMQELITGQHAAALQSWLIRNEVESIFEAEEIASRIRQCNRLVCDLSDSLPRPAMAVSMTEGFPEDEYVFIRGNHKMKGEVAGRKFLTALVGEETKLQNPMTSGRLQLANEITNPENPLTSRVIVNRVWHHLFGRGIVRSVDNFGVLGEAPSHPELLDHLANEFADDGWSIKRLIKTLMLTKAYQRSSKPTEQGSNADPENVLLYRANVRRLQGEAIRDSILSSAGSLNRQMFGPSEAIHITPFMKGRGAPGRKGEIDGKGRRSIYVETRRNFLSPMMLAFDTPIPFNAIGMRSVSNVPAQALILMNDPFVHQQASKFAERVVKSAESTEDRIRFVYQIAFARLPLENEVQVGISFIKSRSGDSGSQQDALQVWKDYCHVVFNIKEFIYLN